MAGQPWTGTAHSQAHTVRVFPIPWLREGREKQPFSLNHFALKSGSKKSTGTLWSHLSWLQIYKAIAVKLEFGSVKEKKKHPMLVANNHSTKKKALQGWDSLIDGLLFNPQSYGDKSFHWRLWRSCVTQGVRQHGGKTVPGAEQAQGWGGRRVLLQPGTGDEAGAGSGTEAAVGLGGQMDKFWGTALQKQSVWRGDGGMEPNLTTCSVLQGQRDASPSSEQSTEQRHPHTPCISWPLSLPLL